MHANDYPENPGTLAVPAGIIAESIIWTRSHSFCMLDTAVTMIPKKAVAPIESNVQKQALLIEQPGNHAVTGESSITRTAA